MLSKVLLVIMLMFLVGCASLQTEWGKLTPEQQSAFILGGLQDQLTLWFDAGKAYVVSHPDRADLWQGKVIPLFDVANHAIKDAIIYKKSPSLIYAEVSPTVSSVMAALQAWGVTIKE